MVIAKWLIVIGLMIVGQVSLATINLLRHQKVGDTYD